MLTTILIIVLILALVGALPTWGYSRNWGYVDRKYIYGKAVFVYWPLDKMGRLH